MATPSNSQDIAGPLLESQDYFNRSTRVLEEADSGFRPTPSQMSVASQVAHTAQTLDWFIQGVSRPEGFDFDFEKHAKETEAVTSLAAARKWLDKAYANAAQYLRSRSPEELAKPLAGQIMTGKPMRDIVGAMVDHSAHHRGALTVYSRLLGKVPVMPYAG